MPTPRKYQVTIAGLYRRRPKRVIVTVTTGNAGTALTAAIKYTRYRTPALLRNVTQVIVTWPD